MVISSGMVYLVCGCFSVEYLALSLGCFGWCGLFVKCYGLIIAVRVTI